jgi:hypothetical protein
MTVGSDEVCVGPHSPGDVTVEVPPGTIRRAGASTVAGLSTTAGHAGILACGAGTVGAGVSGGFRSAARGRAIGGALITTVWLKSTGGDGGDAPGRLRSGIRIKTVGAEGSGGGGPGRFGRGGGAGGGAGNDDGSKSSRASRARAPSWFASSESASMA